MAIDWFTFFAQIVNFLILIFLLQRFLYHPIIQAMAKREKTIGDRFEASQQKLQEAQQEVDRYQQMQQQLAQQQEIMLDQARVEVEQQKQELMQQAQEEVEATRQHWQETLIEQQDSFLQELRHRMMQQIQDTLRQALEDLADRDLEQHLIQIFLDRLKNLPQDELKKFQQGIIASNHNSEPIFIYSAFAIPEASRQNIIQVVGEQLQSPVNLQFENDPELICGIELRASGYKLAWSMDNYLAKLEENLATVFDEEISNS